MGAVERQEGGDHLEGLGGVQPQNPVQHQVPNELGQADPPPANPAQVKKSLGSSPAQVVKGVAGFLWKNKAAIASLGVLGAGVGIGIFIIASGTVAAPVFALCGACLVGGAFLLTFSAMLERSSGGSSHQAPAQPPPPAPGQVAGAGGQGGQPAHNQANPAPAPGVGQGGAPPPPINNLADEGGGPPPIINPLGDDAGGQAVPEEIPVPDAGGGPQPIINPAPGEGDHIEPAPGEGDHIENDEREEEIENEDVQHQIENDEQLQHEVEQQQVNHVDVNPLEGAQNEAVGQPPVEAGIKAKVADWFSSTVHGLGDIAWAVASRLKPAARE